MKRKRFALRIRKGCERLVNEGCWATARGTSVGPPATPEGVQAVRVVAAPWSPGAFTQIRDTGVVRYVVRLPMAAVLMAILFGRPQAGDLRLQLRDPLIAIRDQRGHVGGFETLRDMLRTIGIPGMEVE